MTPHAAALVGDRADQIIKKSLLNMRRGRVSLDETAILLRNVMLAAASGDAAQFFRFSEGNFELAGASASEIAFNVEPSEEYDY